MKIMCSYAEASQRYPEALAEVIAKLRASKSKFSATDPEDLQWSFSVAWRCDHQYLGSPTCARSLYLWEEGRVMVALCAEVSRRSGWGGGVLLSEIPEEVKQMLVDRCDKQARDARNYAALSQEEKQAQFEEALKILRRSPGFIELTVELPKGQGDAGSNN